MLFHSEPEVNNKMVEKMTIDLDQMLRPVEGDSPAGTNEEYSPIFMEMDELAIGVAPSQMGDSVIAGRDPDWKKLNSNCQELWKTTRDLRVAVYFSLSRFSMDGLGGLSQGLSLIEYLVKELWDSFYPELDADDDNDPTERLNILSTLSPVPGTFNDPIMFINHFRAQKLTDGKKYTLRDYMISTGDLEAKDEQVDAALLNAEMRTVPIAEMQERNALVKKIREQLQSISEAINTHTDGGTALFAPLQGELKILERFYAQYILPAGNETESTSTEKELSLSAEADSVSRNDSFNIVSTFPKNREEALLFLQKGAEFFQRSEPTSPVPFLVRRALRMADMNFLDLLGDIEPSALEKGREILGVKKQTATEE